MKTDKKPSANNSINIIWKSIAISVLYGLLISGILILAFAFLLSHNNLPEGAVPLFSIIALTVGSFVSGIIISKKHKKRGAMLGAFCGIVIYLVIAIASLIKFGFSFSNMALWKIIFTILPAMIGGIIGVNIRKKPKF